MTASEDVLISARQLTTTYDTRVGLQKLYMNRDASQVRAVDDVSFEIRRGEAFGLIGESGCGKTTLGRSLVRLEQPTSGSVTFDGVDITHRSRRDMLPFRKRLQIVHQDPYSSLNPRRNVTEIVQEPLIVHRIGAPSERRDRVRDMLLKVGLTPDAMTRYPHQFSGGQRQRIAIARALISDPQLVVCDEPVSALDVSVQAQVLEKMKELQIEFALTYVFVSHDLAVVGYLCNRIAVMYLGKIVEIGETRQIIETPRHPYTRALLSSVPNIAERTTERVTLKGELPSPSSPPSGCRFHTRCPVATEQCRHIQPALEKLKDGRSVACIHQTS